MEIAEAAIGGGSKSSWIEPHRELPRWDIVIVRSDDRTAGALATGNPFSVGSSEKSVSVLLSRKPPAMIWAP